MPTRVNVCRSVADLQPGEVGKIFRFLDDQMAGKLIDMGVLPGCMVQVVRMSPFGGGLYLKIGGHNFAIRKAEASQILVDEV